MPTRCASAAWVRPWALRLVADALSDQGACHRNASVETREMLAARCQSLTDPTISDSEY